jgi:hypothetical protein
MILSQIAFALGACGGLARILMPSAVKTASKDPVNWPARSQPHPCAIGLSSAKSSARYQPAASKSCLVQASRKAVAMSRVGWASL